MLRHEIRYRLWILPTTFLKRLVCRVFGHRWVERCERYVTRDNDYNEDWFDECTRCNARCKDSSTFPR